MNSEDPLKYYKEQVELIVNNLFTIINDSSNSLEIIKQNLKELYKQSNNILRYNGTKVQESYEKIKKDMFMIYYKIRKIIKLIIFFINKGELSYFNYAKNIVNLIITI